MKVIHIAEAAGLGGLQNWVCSLAEAQVRRGFEVELMQPPWIDPASRVYSTLPVHEWDPERVPGFDLVHSHGISGFQNKRIRREARKPIVHTYYGTIVGIQIALRWFQNLVGWNGLDTPRNILREAASGQAANAVIAISPKVQSEIRRFYGIAGKKISVIPGGYLRGGDNTSRECLRRTMRLPESRFLFLFVGRADPVKNPSAALAAFHAVRSRFPEAGLVLAPKQDLPANEDVFTVELEPHMMGQLYRAVDALIHPSVYDAYSLAVHEAMASGLPVIVSRGTGAADYCTDRTDALILPPKRGSGLVDALAEMMCSLIESQDLRLKLGKAAASKFGAMDWDWVDSETAEVYSRL
jgi:glycosyltransferase involved in cell wall biosynthesis